MACTAARWTVPGHAPERVKAVALSSFDYPVAKIGVAGPVTVYYDPDLKADGQKAAQALLADSLSAYGRCQGWFGISGSPVNAIIAPLSGSNDGSGGAYHGSCNFATGGDLYLDLAAGDAPMQLGLFVAELSECFMGAQNKSWDCGFSHGEALSRVMAADVSGGPNGAMAGFATVPAWDKAGRPDWVDKSSPSDQDDVATGCGVAYLYWMTWNGTSLTRITQAGGATLAENYRILTGKDTAWADLQAALKNLQVTGDDPFSSSTTPRPAPIPTPSPSPSPSATGSWDPAALTVGLPTGWKSVLRRADGCVIVHPDLKYVEVPGTWKAT